MRIVRQLATGMIGHHLTLIACIILLEVGAKRKLPKLGTSTSLDEEKMPVHMSRR